MANSFASHAELLTHFFKRLFAAAIKAEAVAENGRLPGIEGLDHLDADSACRVRIFAGTGGIPPVIVVTELEDNIRQVTSKFESELVFLMETSIRSIKLELDRSLPEMGVAEKVDELDELEAELATTLIEIDDAWRRKAEAIDVATIPLEKRDITIDELVLVWLPTAG